MLRLGEGPLFYLLEGDGTGAASSHPSISCNLTTRPPWRTAIRPLNRSLKLEYPKLFQFHEPTNDIVDLVFIVVLFCFLLRPIWVRFSVTWKWKSPHWYRALSNAYWQRSTIANSHCFLGIMMEDRNSQEHQGMTAAAGLGISTVNWIPSGQELLLL